MKEVLVFLEDEKVSKVETPKLVHLEDILFKEMDNKLLLQD